MDCEHRTLNATGGWSAPGKGSGRYRCRCADCGAKGPPATTVAEAVEGFHAYYPIFPEVARVPAISASAADGPRG